MITLKTPISQEDIEGLNVGDRVLLSGTLFTARDRAHRFLLEEGLENIRDSVIYHCGPIVKDNEIVSAGPTTSSRMNPYKPDLINRYGIRAIIGKGGMDSYVLDALKGRAVYLSAFGGAAVLYAKSMEIKAVHKPEFGMAEAIWELEVRDFPAIVAMDSKGRSLYEDVYQKSKNVFQGMIDSG